MIEPKASRASKAADVMALLAARKRERKQILEARYRDIELPESVSPFGGDADDDSQWRSR